MYFEISHVHLAQIIAFESSRLRSEAYDVKLSRARMNRSNSPNCSYLCRHPYRSAFHWEYNKHLTESHALPQYLANLLLVIVCITVNLCARCTEMTRHF